MTRNIYRRGVFEQLVDLSEEIVRISREVHQDYESVIRSAEIEHPNRLLDRSMQHWDRMLDSSSIPSEEQLVTNLQDRFQMDIRRASRVFLPPDELEPVHSEGHDRPDEGDDVNRVSLALESLLHMELEGERLTLDDLEVTVGCSPERGWRTRPYWTIHLREHQIVVFLNNQFGNRTFVAGYRNSREFEELAGYTKEQLKQLSERRDFLVHHFVYEGEGEFREMLSSTVQRVFDGLEMIRPYPTCEEASASARALGITSSTEYNSRYHEDPRLPSNPSKIYGEEFVSWMEFLRTDRIDSRERAALIYQTYLEAKTAVQRLGIRSVKEYKRRYREDPCLPSQPNQRYGEAFVSWTDFLGTDRISPWRRLQILYGAYDEAQNAVQALGIRTAAEYLRRYREDPRLPANPEGKYGELFVSWMDFLGTDTTSNAERSMELYQTYGEARTAVQVLGIQTSAEYLRRYREDPRLPSSPESKYGRTFLNWKDFLGTENKSGVERSAELYQTHEEARDSARRLRVTSVIEYKRRYKEDPCLPSNPDRKYAGEFVSWKDFLGLD